MSVYNTYFDEELLSLLQTDDEAAFNEIYCRHSPALFISAYAMLKNKESAEDAVQEIFISIWKRRRDLQIENLGGYLAQSIRYYILRAYKEGKRNKDFLQQVAEITEDIRRDDPIIFNELTKMLESLIAKLPSDQQIIYRLSREQNMTYAEIAHHLNISVKTVEKKMSLSLKAIRYGSG